MDHNISSKLSNLALRKGFDNRCLLDKWLRIKNNTCSHECLLREIRNRQRIFIEQSMYITDDDNAIYAYKMVVKEVVDYKVVIRFEMDNFHCAEAALDAGILYTLNLLPDIII